MRTDARRVDTKAAFFDIDGTLTSFSTHVVPDSTLRALQCLKDEGMKVFICTGRSPSQLGVVLDTIPVAFDGVVAMNGQYCFDNQGFLETEALHSHDIAVVTAWLDDHPDVVASFCECDYVYFNQITDTMRETWKGLGKTAPAAFVDDPHTRPPEHPTFQISPFIDKAQEIEITGLCENVKGVRWHPDFTDLIPADGGKPVGIQRFLRHYGYTREQCIAFGDGGNDMTMLQFAGIGVAMGNASDFVKTVADYVTDDVDHDGIMNALRHFAIL
ncbi:Cof-type HAD-IIB family hydrolase [Bifidobacterium sp.]|uniref:Cof-type HAD-IIB family hydrolase n=1 Tax=Bifidobacterium sp. TaxID=41200 RepID=UPI0025C3070D|nr:Cof-type HAD-IIB family hydrolase [Bifidobacterium sp.]MCH4210042.1 Cof-type HAD-IIB family hydrolase [Bifidobacterium sp.]MCI1225444.1 Cof-type HAD-IIB family hydrolase [Bifidobacterium sp.]